MSSPGNGNRNDGNGSGAGSDSEQRSRYCKIIHDLAAAVQELSLEAAAQGTPGPQANAEAAEAPAVPTAATPSGQAENFTGTRRAQAAQAQAAQVGGVADGNSRDGRSGSTDTTDGSNTVFVTDKVQQRKSGKWHASKACVSLRNSKVLTLELASLPTGITPCAFCAETQVQ